MASLRQRGFQRDVKNEERAAIIMVMAPLDCCGRWQNKFRPPRGSASCLADVSMLNEGRRSMSTADAIAILLPSAASNASGDAGDR